MALFFLPLGVDVGATSAARGLHSAKRVSIDVLPTVRKPQPLALAGRTGKVVLL
jgi:hypothetical protein